MNRLAVVFILFLFHNGLVGQTHLKGSVRSDGYGLVAVEVININRKIIEKTDDKGHFSIIATIGDEILFSSKGYHERKMKVTRANLDAETVLELEKKAIELKEVEIGKAEQFKNDTSYESLKMTQLTKAETAPKVAGVFTGEIDKGMDFVEIGNKIIKFLDQQMAAKFQDGKAKREVSFKHYVKREFSNEFFITKLNLQESEIDSFITFCENDLKSRDVTQQNGVLDVLQFLLEKRKDYKN